MTTGTGQLTEHIADVGTGSHTAAVLREQALWESFKGRGELAARADLFALYHPLARRIAAKHFHAQTRTDVELNDVVQLACAGLIEAIDRFNPSLGVPFKFYGNRRILGSVLDGLARMTEQRAQAEAWRTARQDRLRSLKADADLASENFNEALAQLGAIANEMAIGFMLEDSGFLSSENTQALESPYDSLVWRQLQTRLAAELELLRPNERAVLSYHYLGAISFRQIAELLALSPGRIAQLHKSALGTLRKRLLKAGITG